MIAIDWGTSGFRAYRLDSEGVTRSADAGGLLHHLFGVRARGLRGELARAAGASYLSGILIGHELRDAPGGATRVQFLGAPPLAALYVRAAACLGIDAGTLDHDAAARALFRLGLMQQS